MQGLLGHACLEHGACPLLDPPTELGLRHLEPEDDRRVAGRLAPEAVLGRRERLPGGGELERPDDAAPVVRMDERRRGGVETGEVVVRRLASPLVVERLPAGALAGPLSETARKTLGLEEAATLPAEEARAAIVTRTRRYAAYQRKWMRRIPGLVSVAADRPAGEVADEILEVARARQHLPAAGGG